MITKLDISNFKSIRHLDIDCKKVNLFIGEPNTGKSNILEALALLSWCGRLSQSLSDYVRFELVQDLFYDRLLDEEIRITIGLSSGEPNTALRVRFERHDFRFYRGANGTEFRALTYDGQLNGGGSIHEQASDIKFFRFRDGIGYSAAEPGSLMPPNGSNLFSTVLMSKDLRETMVEFFRKYGLRLVMRPHEKVFELQKEVDDFVYSCPYSLSSDTLRRIIFYTVAMASNKDSVLVFEEPESNAFPYYTKYLGERIALHQNNQFFIATHNPYLLSAIVEKAPKQDVQVFITYFEDYETKVKPLTSDQLSELMEADPFFNLDHFLGEDR